MSKNILCAVDGSEHAVHAVTAAAEMAKAMGANLTLIVVDQVRFDARTAPLHKYGEEGVQTVLANGQKTAASAGISKPKLVAVASRDVARAILNYADENGVDHIVVGTGEKGAATRFVVGSVSHDLVVRAHCSVTVAR